MTTLIDTNALISILKDTEPHHEWALREFEASKLRGPVIIVDIIYSELSAGMVTQADVDAAVGRLSLDRYPQDDASLFLAGQAFLAYRQRNREAKQVLPDFLIGATAEVNGVPVMTADVKRFKTYFPKVALICP